ncbi:hypothetical protein HYT04_02510 [Candidatus Kaiserbacteria bacterium]|nr:hypothetical protein [Candidatus Kaiserbacteria bacterium]
MTKYLIGAVLFAFVGYGLMEAWPLLAGPTLSIDSPTDNAAFPDGMVTVRGRAERASTILLNGSLLLHDQRDGFSSTLTFPRGGSILTLTATDRFGRTVTATRSVFVPLTSD